MLYFNDCTFQVTLVKNLDHYGIDLKEFAQELQQMAASSTARKNSSLFKFLQTTGKTFVFLETPY